MASQPHPPGPNRPVPLGPHWHHSTFSQGSDSTCVDVAVRRDQVLVRDSKEPTGPVLRFSPREWQVFLHGVRAGEFELPAAAAADDATSEGQQGFQVLPPGA